MQLAQGKPTFLVTIPDTRGVGIAPYGLGNLKLGAGVHTYSRLPGVPELNALGHRGFAEGLLPRGTCPGATEECEKVCYAARPVEEAGAVYLMWRDNSATEDVPPIPADCKLLRIHVSGDFTTKEYIGNWCRRLEHRPDVTAWAYTRSWRVPELLESLEFLRAMPNMQLFASMDKSTVEIPPAGWRRAWIDGDVRAGAPQDVRAHMDFPLTHNLITFDGAVTYVCPEETKRVPDCERCGYCFKGKEHDVTFLLH